MMIRTAETPEGFVVREIFPSGERAYRLHDDGTITYCGNHFGPWVSIDGLDVPGEVLDHFLQREAR